MWQSNILRYRRVYAPIVLLWDAVVLPLRRELPSELTKLQSRSEVNATPLDEIGGPCCSRK